MSVVLAEDIGADGLRWPGASTDQLAFMREVYARHVARARRRRPFIADVPPEELGPLEAGHRLRREAAARGRELLTAVRSALADAQREGRSDAAAVRSIGVASGYRPASSQFAAWQRNFPRYYGETAAEREQLPGGPHGGPAADRLATYIGGRLGAPGFSLHNDGMAVDFRAHEGGVELTPSTTPRSIRSWRGSWAFRTLERTAPRCGFLQNTTIDEPWHWEYRSTAEAVTPSHELVPDSPGPAPGPIAPGRLSVEEVELLRGHRGRTPDLVLRWNAMPASVGEVDVVVHLHGYSSAPDMRLPTHKEPRSGLDWADPAGRDPAPGRTRPTLGILPRGNFFGGRSGAGYDFPALVRPGGLDQLVAHSLACFAAAHRLGDVRRGRLILTAHSGGGQALLTALAHNDPDEVHLFDATYQSAAALARWANRHAARDAGQQEPTGALRVLFRPGTPTERHALGLRRALEMPSALRRRYRVEGTPVGHNDIPRRFGWLLLASAEVQLPSLSRGGHAEGAPPAGTEPATVAPRQPRTTSFLRTAWSRHRCAEQQMTTVRVLSHRTPVNPRAVEAFRAFDRALREAGFVARSTWAYNCRAIRGTTNYSLHAYGLAVDVDPRTNPHRLRTTGPVRFSPEATQAGRGRDVIAGRADTSFTVAQIEAVEAIRTVDGLQVFGWGGRWRTSHDSMHFQIDLTPAELGRGLDPRFLAGPELPPSEEEWSGPEAREQAESASGIYAGLATNWNEQSGDEFEAEPEAHIPLYTAAEAEDAEADLETHGHD